MKTRYWLYIVCKPYVLSASMGMWKPTLLPSVVLEGLINQCTNELSAKYDRIKYFCGCGSVNQSFPDFMGLPHRRFWARYQCPPPPRRENFAPKFNYARDFDKIAFCFTSRTRSSHLIVAIASVTFGRKYVRNKIVEPTDRPHLFSVPASLSVCKFSLH